MPSSYTIEPSGITYVTDRTLADVERWKTLRSKGWWEMSIPEKSEWNGNITPPPVPSAAKGMYTYKDLNRVESAVQFLASKYAERGYDVSDIVTKTDWYFSDRFTIVDAERYLGNISKLRDLSAVYPDTPQAPKVTDVFNFEVANNIEKILRDVESLLNNISSSQFYSGDLFAGEV